MKRTEIPTSGEAFRRIKAGIANALDEFVYIYTPADDEDACRFRKRLADLIGQALTCG